MAGKIRIGSWGALVLCFFLPFCRGCMGVPEFPVKEAFLGIGSLVAEGAPFLYPLLLLVVFGVSRRFREKRWVGVMAKGLCAAVFIGLTWLVGYFINSLYGEQRIIPLGESMLAAAFVLLWGIMAFGIRRLEVDQLVQLFAFQCAALSFCMLLLWFNVCTDRLIGAWLSLVSSGCVVATYVVGWYRTAIHQRTV